MDKYHLIVDVALCENCCNCFLAVKDEYCGNDFHGYSVSQPNHGHRWFDVKEKERGSGSLMDVAYLPVTCNQCSNAPCVRAASDGAITQRNDGIVMIHSDLAKGQRQLVDSCPYGHIWWNEDKQLPQKWSFDAHLLDAGWKEPRPVQSCATAALTCVKSSDAEMTARSEREGLEVLHPEFGTQPRVWYKNLYRFRDAFIAGTVTVVENGKNECAADVDVTLSRNGDVVKQVKTTCFGDFKFDRLPEKSGAYSITVTSAEGVSEFLEVNLSESINLGEILLKTTHP
ncbi:MAG: hypothetical protein QNK24_11680 [Desulfuromusa sp.]|nr:hypothetical protein [Desulfuromusa sp.]